MMSIREKITHFHSLHKNTILLILILAFLLRFALFSIFIIPNKERCMGGDAYGYDRLAVNMLEHHVFSASKQPPFAPNLTRTPLYPVFLSLVYFLFHHNLAVAIFFQVIMGMVSILVTYKLGVKLFNETAALFAAFFLAIDPISIIFSNRLLPETFFTLLLVSGLYFFASSFSKGRMFFLMLAGLLLGLSALTRPISLYLPIALLPILVYKYRSNVSKLIPRLVVFSVAFLMLISPWLIRNYRITGVPVFSTIKDVNILFYRAVGVTAEISGKDFFATQKQFSEQYRLDLVNNREEYRANMRVARQIILSHPVIYAKIAFIGFGKSVLGPGRSILPLLGINTTRWTSIVIIITLCSILALIYFTFVPGVFSLVKDKDYFALAFLFLIIFYFLALPAGPESYSRFRVPVMPYICLVSGLGVYKISSYLSIRRCRSI